MFQVSHFLSTACRTALHSRRGSPVIVGPIGEARAAACCFKECVCRATLFGSALHSRCFVALTQGLQAKLERLRKFDSAGGADAVLRDEVRRCTQVLQNNITGREYQKRMCYAGHQLALCWPPLPEAAKSALATESGQRPHAPPSQPCSAGFSCLCLRCSSSACVFDAQSCARRQQAC